MGKHGTNVKLWPSIIVFTALALIVSAWVFLIILDPRWTPKG